MRDLVEREAVIDAINAALPLHSRRRLHLAIAELPWTPAPEAWGFIDGSGVCPEHGPFPPNWGCPRCGDFEAEYRQVGAQWQEFMVVLGPRRIEGEAEGVAPKTQHVPFQKDDPKLYSSSPLVEQEEGRGHRELLCERCGREHAIWFAANEIWNEVVGDSASFLCPNCFMALADERFGQQCWEVRREAVGEAEGPEKPSREALEGALREIASHSADWHWHPGLPWKHWSQIAREALDGASREARQEGAGS